MDNQKCESPQLQEPPHREPFRAAIALELEITSGKHKSALPVFSNDDKEVASLLRSSLRQSLRRRGTPIEMPSVTLMPLP